jgi:1-acyl-sn-glycerol-3-phosphate acyltransferase
MTTMTELAPMTAPSPAAESRARWPAAHFPSMQRARPDDPWSPFCYALGRTIGRVVFFQCIRSYVIRPEIPERAGAYVLALTHLGNLDPFASGVLIRRRLRWMTRKEFFKYRICAWALRKVGCFCVNRQGIPVSAIRKAISILHSGQIVAICPEGGRTTGPDSAIHGGRIKRGVCSIAIRSGAAVVPCVMLGTPGLNRVKSWLPFKHGRLWVAYGQPIEPPPGPSTRAKRDALRDQIMSSYTNLYAELRRQYGLEAGEGV